MEQARQILKKTFGFSEFRLSQAQVVERLIEKDKNVLVLYPTGGGKSLCYQIPALCLDGLTLVISPLIALMKDQVDVLRSKGVQAASLDSSQTVTQSNLVKTSIKEGTLKILYVAPERLNNETFVEMMRSVNISLVAIDESHCISQWGTTFRPEYLKVARFVQEFGVQRLVCLCLTATATPPIALDICNGFNIDPEEGTFRIPMFRPNLSFLVKVAENLEDKLAQVVPILKERTGPAIVYVTLQAHAEEGARLLQNRGLEAKMYHAGMSSEDRQSIQDYFMASERGIVVATIAFGTLCSIDKNNIRQVIHLYMPKTLENYSQEVGRAGRDGLPSTCIMFLSEPDIPTLEGFCRGDTCSKTSIHLWLQEVMLKEPGQDGTIAINQYEQTRTYDIKSTTLALLYAELELQEGLIRAVTPYYAVYEFNPKSPQASQIINRDEHPTAKAIRSCMRARKAQYQYIIDVTGAEKLTPFSRSELSKWLMHWEMDGLIDIKASQVRNRYQILRERPTSQEEIEKLADVMHKRMVEREETAVARLRSVVQFATDNKCLADTLAAYFGDSDVVPDHHCGRCSYCIDGAMPPFDAQLDKIQSLDPSLIRRVLDICPDRDDPLLLTRIAYGISSPRITMLKLGKNPVFGSLASENWGMLVKAFEEACEKGDQTRATSAPSEAMAARTSSVKRKQDASSSASRSSKQRRFK
ncbi:ATP-dependent DNA helicase [Cantharellus anzutake]|uniref:ATP-dependent DNA helicase n=1 Tax=Cantharellus anzutake TaxID=1750568 RepID=UPI0019051498|nr:ATP-dependent DNA helicase [Cantharellus anzutake]KAF8334003.1 ATP-dependent DNA helicase [Cantharellus anzutake]